MTSLWLDTAGPLPTGAPPAPGQPYDTLVAGAGLTGLTTALLLARQGQRVGLLEARSVGAVTTGNTTAKLSLLQGTVLARIRQRHGDEVLRAYVEANADAQAWLLGFLAEHEVAHQVRTAFTYATTDAGERSLAAELDAAQAVGLPVEWSADPGLPFAVDRAITLAGQAQFHPRSRPLRPLRPRTTGRWSATPPRLRGRRAARPDSVVPARPCPPITPLAGAGVASSVEQWRHRPQSGGPAPPTPRT
ncbi:MAG TPA: FAD-dependent oxidoreductase [Propionicimonas sp.]|nr:FAD-dependent oxidoreductase [Propionicimonas sp.]HQD97549.1 FAD-dependent oxidoreductase [Propionicimonas sp.]